MTVALQAFKETDLQEAKVAACFLPSLETLSTALDEFNAGAYTCFKLGNVLISLRASPMVGVVSDDTFMRSFFAIHEFFTRPGTFEFYLDVFRTIWGPDVDVVFTVPDPGKLQIDITALTIIEADFLARQIVSDHYVYSEMVDHVGDNIEFQVPSGIKTQREADALINELHPAGVWVENTLTIS